eukprot:4125077-Prymnesium_polylepis.1
MRTAGHHSFRASSVHVFRMLAVCGQNKTTRIDGTRRYPTVPDGTRRYPMVADGRWWRPGTVSGATRAL